MALTPPPAPSQALPPKTSSLSARGENERIRVFLVDDSPVALVMLMRMLATSPEIEVVGAARSGREALARFESARPNVICTDYHMPDMDGLALIQRTMEVFPRPILVISSVIDPSQREKIFPLLAAGAVDVTAKPGADQPFEQAAAALVQKIKLLSGVVVISRRAPAAANIVLRERPPSRSPALSAASDTVSAPTNSGDSASKVLWTPASRAGVTGAATRGIRVVAIGASTGGPQALQTIFMRLPTSFPCPIVCVQHISEGFLAGLVDWLNAQCRVRVKIADNGEMSSPGTIYFPAENTHLEINAQGRLSYSHAPPVDGHKPSVTATFDSVARHFGPAAVGVLLTGMGSDGAAGLESMRRAGATTIAQDEASCVVFGMPRQAILRDAAQMVLPPSEIADFMLRLTPAVPS